MPKKILLIEDEKMLAEMYEERLKREGFDVLRSVDGEGGFAIAKEEKPDLIILDIILPDVNKDGTDILKQLKADKDIKDIPVILFSNYDTPEVRKIARDCNTNYILKTSATTKDLVDAINRELKNK